MTLENVLRGTGDIGAMCDAVWGLEHQRKREGRRWNHDFAEESKSLTRLTMKCVKPRDFEPAETMVIQGRPFIDERGDFEVISQAGMDKPSEVSKSEDRVAVMVRMIEEDRSVSCQPNKQGDRLELRAAQETRGAFGLSAH